MGLRVNIQSLYSDITIICSGFVNDENIKDYAQCRKKYAEPKRKGNAFIDAVKKIEEYIQDPVVSSLAFVCFFKHCTRLHNS